MRAGWPKLPLLQVADDVTGGQPKTKQEDYLPSGQFALVDQGRAMVGGYTDNQSALANLQLPVIAFGDHTKCIKFVDFPFGLGADGVKLLRARDCLDPRFLFHFLLTVQMPAAGYSRHFKFLKEQMIPLPPIEEQRRIAAVLDAADALRAKRRQALSKLDTLTQAIFIDMFGDPLDVRSEGKFRSMQTSVGELAHVRTGKLDANAGTPDGDYPFFTCAVKPLRIDEYAFDTRAVLVAGNGDLNVKYFEGKFNAYQRTYVIDSRDESIAHPRFLHGFLDLYVGRLRREAIGGVIKYIKLGNLTDAKIGLPSLARQLDFDSAVRSVASQRAATEQSLAQLDALFASLQQRAFRGEL